MIFSCFYVIFGSNETNTPQWQQKLTMDRLAELEKDPKKVQVRYSEMRIAFLQKLKKCQIT